MYIQPDTIIRLLTGIPMDNSYRDSLYFDDVTAQTNYFIGKTKQVLTSNSYQRKERGYIRVNLPISSCFDCNYLMYKNNLFENKWIYAFITSVNYINNAVTEIQFEVDILQTWYFDYEMDECYIEREHVPDDTIGLHTLPENLDTGGYYVCNAEDFLIDLTETTALVFSSYDVTQTVSQSAAGGQIISNIFQGCYVYPFPMHDFTNNGTSMTKAESIRCLNNFLSYLVNVNQVESITSIILVPDALIPSYTCTYTGTSTSYAIQTVEWSSTPRSYTVDTQAQGSSSGVARPTTLNDYVPRNNKMFTFPYCCLYVHNTLGQGQTYRWECFGNNRAVGIFNIVSQLTPNPEAIILPVYYKNQALNYDESIPISEFPMLSFNYDAFKAWIASGGLAKDIINLGGSVGRNLIAGSVASEGENASLGIAGAGLGIAMGVANTITDVAIHSIQPNVIKGTQQGSTMMANELLGFKCLSLTVRREVAVYIDNYFTRYGYRVCARKTPNRKNRTRYTYIRTNNATLSGSIPVNDANAICSIYDKGITWWTDHDNVGNYSYTNSTL